MFAVAPFWLAGAAIIALMSFWARANRRSGWRRRRPEANPSSLGELLALEEELRRRNERIPSPIKLAARPQPPVSATDLASLIALQAALSRSGLPPQTPAPQPQTTAVRAPAP